MNKKRLLIIAGVLCTAAFIIFQSLTPPVETAQRQQLTDVFPTDTKDIFERSEAFTLLSLHPTGNHQGKDAFHGYRVLGKTTVSAKTKMALISTLYTALAAEDASAASCFWPRHGIRAVHNGKTVDLVICFACQQLVVIPPGKNRKTVEWPGLGHPIPTVSNSAEPMFDNVLKKAKVPLVSDSNED